MHAVQEPKDRKALPLQGTRGARCGLVSKQAAAARDIGVSSKPDGVAAGQRTCATPDT